MKRFLGAVVLLATLALGAACGSGGGGDVQEGRAPPTGESMLVDSGGDTIDELVEATAVVTPTAESVPSLATPLQEQMGELVLSEDDVPVGFSELMSMSLDMEFDFLAEAGVGEATTYLSVFADSAGEDMLVSMAFYVEGGDGVGEALTEMNDLPFDELEDAFGMLGGFMDMELVNTREIDVSSLGEGGFGFGMTVDMGELGTMDAEFAMWSDGPVVAMVMTMAMGGGSAMDVVPLAETMADKIEAAQG